MVLRSFLFVSMIGATAAACGDHKNDTLFLDYAVETKAGAPPGTMREAMAGIPPEAVSAQTTPAGEAQSGDMDGGAAAGDSQDAVSCARLDWRFDGAGCAPALADDDLVLEPVDEAFADRDELDDDIADDILEEVYPDIDDELNND